MSAQPLTLVKPAAPDTATDASEYTPAEAAAIAAYQDVLTAGRYFKLFNAASPLMRLISGDNTEPLPLSFLSSDFADFCRETGRRLPKKMPTDSYLAGKLRTVVGTTFFPNGPNLIRAERSRHRYVNMYQSFEAKHPPIALSPLFAEFLDCLFPDAAERHTFTQYCAHMIQQPQERPSWHPMLLSETGTGKGFLYNDILRPLLCRQTFLVKKYGEILGKFSPVMQNALLVLLDDCKSRRDDTQVALKSLMTEETVLMEQKGLQAGMVPTYARFFLASNEQVPLDLDDTERRWWVCKRLGYSHGLTGKAGRDDRQALIKRLSDWLKLDGAIEAVYAYFAGYSLEGFDAKNCPMTDTLQEQIAKSVPIEQGLTLDFLNNHANKVVKSGELTAYFAGEGMTKPSNAAVSKLFAACEYRAEHLTVQGVKTRWWFPGSMTKDEAEAILEASASVPERTENIRITDAERTPS